MKGRLQKHAEEQMSIQSRRLENACKELIRWKSVRLGYESGRYPDSHSCLEELRAGFDLKNIEPYEKKARQEIEKAIEELAAWYHEYHQLGQILKAPMVKLDIMPLS
jgi:hypothetical protein